MAIGKHKRSWRAYAVMASSPQISGAPSAARRRCRDGQPQQPQGGCRQAGDPFGRRSTDISAALQPRSEPIEQAFSKLKTLLRKENARTREHIEKCIGTLLDRITTEECANSFREAGYST
jgi:hypothetical protein